MDFDSLIDSYFEAKDKIHEAFGYEPDWKEIPLEDRRGCHWMIVGSERTGSVVWSDKPFTEELVIAGKEIYSGPIYTQRFLPKWVYRTDTHVLVSVDTQTDGNKFLMIFDVDKECKDENMKETYNQYW